jgi:hypothetical protein
MRIACLTTKATYTLRIRNTYCFSTATVIAINRLNDSYTYITCLFQYDLVPCSRASLKRDGTRAETRFGLSEKWTSPFKSAGESVQSTTGSRGVRIRGQTMDRPRSEAQCKSTGYPLQSPISFSLPLPRVTVCHHVSNGLYSPIHIRIYHTLPVKGLYCRVARVNPAPPNIV